MRSRESRGGWARLVSLLVLAVTLAPLHANADDPTSNHLRFGTFSSSSKGYLGCVVSPRPALDLYCFVAHQMADGPDAGKVEVISMTQKGGAATSISRAIVASDSLVYSDKFNPSPTMTFTASLPEIGDVSLHMRNNGPFGGMLGVPMTRPQQ